MTTTTDRRPLLSSPGAPALLTSSIIAPLPLAMFSIALLRNAQRQAGSFGAAGIVSGAYAIAGAFSAPLLGGLVDRVGQTVVLICGSGVTALSLVATRLLPHGTSAVVLVALAATSGFATPPLEAWRAPPPPAGGSRPRGRPAALGAR